MKKLHTYIKVSSIALISFFTFTQNVFADLLPTPDDKTNVTPPTPTEQVIPSEYIAIGIIVIIIVIVTLIILSKIKKK